MGDGVDAFNHGDNPTIEDDLMGMFALEEQSTKILTENILENGENIEK